MGDQKRDRIYSAAEAEERLARDLPRWAVVDGRLSRTFRLHGWKAVPMVVATIAHLAEAAWHHPEIEASYGKVTVRLTTHSAGGITDKDFQLAAKIEAVVLWRPGREGGALDGTPPEPRFAYLKYED